PRSLGSVRELHGSARSRRVQGGGRASPAGCNPAPLALSSRSAAGGFPSLSSRARPRPPTVKPAPPSAESKTMSPHSAASPAPTATPAASVGSQLAASETVREAIDTIVEEVRSHSGRITDVRGPEAQARESYEELMARAAQVRGRGLLYPYLGAGRS